MNFNDEYDFNPSGLRPPRPILLRNTGEDYLALRARSDDRKDYKPLRHYVTPTLSTAWQRNTTALRAVVLYCGSHRVRNARYCSFSA